MNATEEGKNIRKEKEENGGMMKTEKGKQIANGEER
jgi:hypothetical protein